MSLKPVKKSDCKKSWMNNRRDKPRKIQPEYHLIVTEGTKTEPLYFERIKELINEKFRGRICLEIHGEGDNTLALFQRAKQLVATSPNTYKHVWIVFDTDDFPANNINKTVELCDNENINSLETCYHALWSNQCIEYWYLLHFCYNDTDMPRGVCSHKLSRFLTDIGCAEYKKNRVDMFDVLYPYLDTALKHAKRINENNKGKKASEAAPGTKVFELMELLKAYL